MILSLSPWTALQLTCAWTQNIFETDFILDTAMEEDILAQISVPSINGASAIRQGTEERRA
jgi:hypothetical protein